MTQKLQIGDFVDFIDPAAVGAKSPAFELREGRQWFCIQVQPGCHKRVEFELAERGLRSFYPRLRRWVSHARTKTAKEFPILGRYVFVEACPETFWAVAAVHGVDSFVADARGPVVIPPSMVTQFRDRYLSGEWDMVRRDCPRPVWGVVKGKDGQKREVVVDYQTNPELPIGARIRVMVGEFENLLATITERDGKKITFKLRDKNTYGSLNESGVRAA